MVDDTTFIENNNLWSFQTFKHGDTIELTSLGVHIPVSNVYEKVILPGKTNPPHITVDRASNLETHMFGLFDQYTETAQAIILSTKLLNYRMTGEHVRHKYEFILEVQPTQGEPFRTTIKQHLPLMTRTPQTGETVNARYDPKNRKVQLVFKGDARYDLNLLVKAQREAEQKRQQAILSSPPGTPVPPPSTDIYRQMFRRTKDTGSPE